MILNNGVVEFTTVGPDSQAWNRRLRLTESYPQRKHEAEDETRDRASLIARRNEHTERVQAQHRSTNDTKDRQGCLKARKSRYIKAYIKKIDNSRELSQNL